MLDTRPEVDPVAYTGAPGRARRPMLDLAIPATMFVAVSIYALVFHVRIPYYDHWSIAPLVGRMGAGNLTVADLFGLHGSHWHASGYVVMLANARLAAMTPWIDIAASLVVAALGFVALVRIVDRSLGDVVGPDRRWLIMAVVGYFYFSLDQSENWLWGWQVALFLSTTMSLWAIELLGRGGLRMPVVGLAGVSATVAVYGFATAWALLPVGLFLVWTCPAVATARRFVAGGLWIGVFGLLLTHYRSIDDPYAAQVAPRRWSPGVVVGHVDYVTTYLGAGLVRSASTVATVLAITGAIILVVVLVKGQRPVPAAVVNHRGLLALAGYSVGSGALTALGRWSRFGSTQALASRYVTFANYFWIAVLVIVMVAAFGSARSRGRAPLFLAVGAVLLLKGYSSVDGRDMVDRAREANAAVCGIVSSYPDTDPELLDLVSAPTQPMDRFLAVLEREQLGLFRPDVVDSCERSAQPTAARSATSNRR